MIRFAALAVAASLSFACAGQAQQAYRSINYHYVVPLNANSMEVVERADSGVRDVWCAAADYVRRVLGDPRRARLYLIAPSGPARTAQGRRGTSFTISAEAAGNPSPSYSASLRTVGTNLSVAAAWNYCRDTLDERFGF
ncbi:hypothetical protein R5H30_03385 [Sulfitobacter sp. D35]|uniref:hypothetical protein n=1 Tax=Sulfitobacter sp. D35 TaxID=3083252 RepID=UPI00296E9105|nr:hypothetical protein [Sulfitobacter sp. D35]MDW4497011.1 hypothetical protein [Sulfitobacter sp. D35]